MSGNTTGFEDDDLRDPALRRALDHAPDRDAVPGARTRDAILKMAHNLAASTLDRPQPQRVGGLPKTWDCCLLVGDRTQAKQGRATVEYAPVGRSHHAALRKNRWSTSLSLEA